MTTTYCEVADVEDILSEAGVTAYTDDPEDGTRDAADTAHVTTASERAATRINSQIEMTYKLADVAGNTWLKWCNATMAALAVATRRLEPAPARLVVEVDEYKSDLQEIKLGTMKLPEQAASFDTLPTVTNFDVERGRGVAPIRVRPDESTGPFPHSSRKRRTAREPRREYD